MPRGTYLTSYQPPSGRWEAQLAPNLFVVLADRRGCAQHAVLEQSAVLAGEPDMPQPLLAAGWILAETDHVWAGPAPLLLGLRNPVLLAEELTWTAARHPGRVGAVVAPGYAAADFEALGEDYEARNNVFAARLETLMGALTTQGPIGGDPAVAAWVKTPGPVLSAGNSPAAARRAARHGVGMLFQGGEDTGHLAQLTRDYREAGGTGLVAATLSVWAGELPTNPESEALDQAYRTAAVGMRHADGLRNKPLSGPTRDIVERGREFGHAVGAEALNLRVHVPGVDRQVTLDQIAQIGAEVLPGLRAALVG